MDILAIRQMSLLSLASQYCIDSSQPIIVLIIWIIRNDAICHPLYLYTNPRRSHMGHPMKTPRSY